LEGYQILKAKVYFFFQQSMVVVDMVLQEFDFGKCGDGGTSLPHTHDKPWAHNSLQGDF
jgi:hypothetical protein